MEINSIHREFQHSLRNYIRTKVRREADAEDILQEVFIRIALKGDTLQDRQKVSNWIFTITRNAITDYYRKQARQQQLIYTDELPAAPTEAAETDVTRGLDQCLLRFVQQLPEEYRDIIIDSELKNIRQKELAEKYGMPYSSLRSRVQRGRSKLKQLLVKCCVIEADKWGNILKAELRDTGESDCHQCG